MFLLTIEIKFYYSSAKITRSVVFDVIVAIKSDGRVNIVRVSKAALFFELLRIFYFMVNLVITRSLSRLGLIFI